MKIRFIEKFKKEITVWRLVLQDSETPRISKWLLALAIGYLVMPFDLIPDFIPVVGQLDDLIIVPALVYVAVLFVPKGVVERCRRKAER